MYDPVAVSPVSVALGVCSSIHMHPCVYVNVLNVSVCTCLRWRAGLSFHVRGTVYTRYICVGVLECLEALDLLTGENV